MIVWCSNVAPKNTRNRGSGRATMNCVPMMPAVDFSALEEVLVVLTPTPAREAEESRE